jgi:pSer/pThr/pTyr-binding forkhead associated (FHA) protein
MPAPPPAQPLFAYLERVGQGTAVPLVAVEGDVLTFGRDGSVAQVVVDEPSVSRLHARIRHQDNSYWLYDEGSTAGTYLNFERLGLAPRHLQDGDIVELGRVRFRFLLRPYPVEPPPEAEEEE